MERRRKPGTLRGGYRSRHTVEPYRRKHTKTPPNRITTESTTGSDSDTGSDSSDYRRRDGTPEGYVYSDPGTPIDLRCSQDSDDISSGEEVSGSDDDLLDDFIDDRTDADVDRGVYRSELLSTSSRDTSADNSADDRVSAAAVLSGIRRGNSGRPSHADTRTRPVNRVVRDARTDVYFGLHSTSVYAAGEKRFITDCGKYINSDAMHDIILPGHVNCIQSPMGSGKTYLLRKYVEWVKRNKPEAKIIYLANSISLCEKAAEVLGFQSYQQINIQDEIRAGKLKNLVICVNSLLKLKLQQTHMDFTVVIIDEIVGCLDNIFGSGLIQAQARKPLIELLSRMCNPWRQGNPSACTTILLDALFGEREVHFVKEIVGADKQLRSNEQSRINMFRFFPPAAREALPEICLIADKNRWMRQLVHTIAQRPDSYRVALMTSLKEQVFDLLSLIRLGDPNLMDDLRIELELADQAYGKGWLWIDAKTEKTLRNNIVANPDVLQHHNRFAFTPVFSSGVSFELPYDVAFFIGGTFMSANQTTQMFRRIRNIRERKIFIHIVGGKTELPFELTLEKLKQMITDYDKLDEKHRTALCASITGKRLKQNEITSYFRSQKDQDVIDLLAYTMLDTLRFQADPWGHLQRIMQMNDTTWKLVVDGVKTDTSPVTGTRLKELVKNNLGELAGDVVRTSRDSLLCMDAEELTKSLNDYGALGKYAIKDLDMKRNVAFDASRQANALFTDRCRMAITPFSLLTQFLFIGCRNGSTAYYNLRDYYNLGRMLTAMFLALGNPWSKHVKQLKHPSVKWTVDYICLRLDLLEELYVDTYMVIGRWKALVTWLHDYSAVLSINSISIDKDIKADVSPSAASVTNMRGIVMAVFGLLGIQMKMTDEFVQQNGKSQGKRRRQALTAALKEAERLGYDQCCVAPQSRTVCVTLNRTEPKLAILEELYDRSLRRDILEYNNASGPTHFMRNISASTQTHSVDDLDKKVVAKYYALLKKLDQDLLAKYMDSPSVWVVNDPQTYRCYELLAETSQYLEEFMEQVFERVEAARTTQLGLVVDDPMDVSAV